MLGSRNSSIFATAVSTKHSRTGEKLPETTRQIRKDWGQGAAITLMFQDEARFGRINDVRRCWAPKPIHPRCQATLTHEYTYVYAAVDVQRGVLDTLVLPHVNTDCMQAFLDEVAQHHRGGAIVMVLNGAGWHRSNALCAPANMYLLPSPPYAPELNPVEHLRDELREKYFHNRVFDSFYALEDHLVASLRATEEAIEKVRSIVAWPWIIDALTK